MKLDISLYIRDYMFIIDSRYEVCLKKVSTQEECKRKCMCKKKCMIAFLASIEEAVIS